MTITCMPYVLFNITQVLVKVFFNHLKETWGLSYFSPISVNLGIITEHHL